MEPHIIARIIHVVCVVFWIGGVAMVTTVMIPALRGMDKESEPFKIFHEFERRFARQARFTTAMTAASGAFMIHSRDGWSQIFQGSQWWLHAMIGIWILFSIMLFIIEPFVLPRMVGKISPRGSRRVFPVMHYLHIVLLIGSVIAIMGGVAAAHGFL
ncbi:MAG: hypothetical protein HQL76_14400 [Magnetococcales bacterium]|nr:hypothetical protein [Magnetococcales bacterium]